MKYKDLFSDENFCIQSRNNFYLSYVKISKLSCLLQSQSIGNYHNSIVLFSINRPLPNYLWPLFQSESCCLSFHMKIRISRSMYNCLKIIASCLKCTMLAHYATTGLPLKQQHKSKDLVLFSKSCYQSSKCGNFKLLFCKGRHGIVVKCMPHVQHAYFSLFNQ